MLVINNIHGYVSQLLLLCYIILLVEDHYCICIVGFISSGTCHQASDILTSYGVSKKKRIYFHYPEAISSW